MSKFSEYFNRLPAEAQETFHEAARRCPLQLPRCPLDTQIVEEILAWGQLENDVLRAHADWLSRTKAKFEARGIEWTVENLNARSYLWEHE